MIVFGIEQQVYCLWWEFWYVQDFGQIVDEVIVVVVGDVCDFGFFGWFEIYGLYGVFFGGCVQCVVNLVGGCCMQIVLWIFEGIVGFVVDDQQFGILYRCLMDEVEYVCKGFGFVYVGVVDIVLQFGEDGILVCFVQVVVYGEFGDW